MFLELRTSNRTLYFILYTYERQLHFIPYTLYTVYSDFILYTSYSILYTLCAAATVEACKRHSALGTPLGACLTTHFSLNHHSLLATRWCLVLGYLWYLVYVWYFWYLVYLVYFWCFWCFWYFWYLFWYLVFDTWSTIRCSLHFRSKFGMERAFIRPHKV